MFNFVFDSFHLFSIKNCSWLKTRLNSISLKVHQKQVAHFYLNSGLDKNYFGSGYLNEHKIKLSSFFHGCRHIQSQWADFDSRALANNIINKLMELLMTKKLYKISNTLREFIEGESQDAVLIFKKSRDLFEDQKKSIFLSLFSLKICFNSKVGAMLNYKGYTAQIEIDSDQNFLCGRVLGLKDVITFKGKTVEEARQAFQDSVDDYLEWCQELGEEPEKPFSGRLPYRTTPETHRQIFLAAKKTGKSINSWMDEVLSREANRTIHA